VPGGLTPGGASHNASRGLPLGAAAAKGFAAAGRIEDSQGAPAIKTKAPIAVWRKRLRDTAEEDGGGISVMARPCEG
jgi:hypothetical protein